MSIFKRKASKASLFPKDGNGNGHGSPTLPSSPPAPHKSPPRAKKSSYVEPPYSGPIDDFGRRLDTPQPAFNLGGGVVPFGQGHGVGDEEEGGTELQLLYGYTPLGTTIELNVAAVGEIVVRCADEIRRRGLDTPLILSSVALDISLEGSCSLIRSYISGDMKPWLQDLALAAPLSVGAFLKWALARLVNDQGGRGFLPWELYNSFKSGEKLSSYPTGYCSTHLIKRLLNRSSDLLFALLSLFSSVAAHSSKSGMTPRRLAGLFSPYIFGLSDDRAFDDTYSEWQRTTDATEHVLLAFIRDQKAESGQLPTHLEKFIGGYPGCLNVGYAPGAVPRVPKGGRVEEVTRVKRNTRFHSRNLISSAGSWDVLHSTDWQLFLPGPRASANSQQPTFTPHYRHLLNIRAHSLEDGGEVDEGELQRYKTVVEKEWGVFGEKGFKDVDAAKLEFDLTENERSHVKAKHETMDWGTFASSGFAGRETFAPTDLIFHQTISHRVAAWPQSQQSINFKLRETEKMLPPFPWDTTPHEDGRILVDINFFEAWADVLVSGGWARDELKECSFALVQWKSRPREGELPKGRAVQGDDRTEEKWVLVEEYVPQKYREELRDSRNKKPSKRVSFLRAVRKKSVKGPSRLQISQPSYPSAIPEEGAYSPYGMGSLAGARHLDDSVFAPGNETTKIISLSSLAIDSRSGYAPSISTTGAGHGHRLSNSIDGDGVDARSPDLPPAIPMPPMQTSPVISSSIPPGVGGGTMSSQRRESAFDSGRGPVGFTKPVSSKGFLARLGTRKNRHAPAKLSPPPASAGGSSTSNSLTPRDSSLDTTRAGGHGAFAPAAQPFPAHLLPGDGAHPPAAPHSDDGSSIGPPPPPKSIRDTTYSEDPSSPSTPTATSSEDPYGGIEDDEVQEGTVLFRGSRAFAPATPISIQVEGLPEPNAQSPTARQIRRLPVPPVNPEEE